MLHSNLNTFATYNAQKNYCVYYDSIVPNIVLEYVLEAGRSLKVSEKAFRG